jgi:hypothetical protein
MKTYSFRLTEEEQEIIDVVSFCDGSIEEISKVKWQFYMDPNLNL